MEYIDLLVENTGVALGNLDGLDKRAEWRLSLATCINRYHRAPDRAYKSATGLQTPRAASEPLMTWVAPSKLVLEKRVA